MTKIKKAATVKPITDKTILEVDRLERLNTWVNILTAQGTKGDRRYSTYFSTYVNRLHDDTLESLFHQNDLAKRIVQQIVLDAFRKDPIYSIQTVSDVGGSEEDTILGGDNVVSDVIASNWEINQKAADGAIWGRLYGCGAVLLGVMDNKPPNEEMELPIKPGTLRWLEVVDKRNLIPMSYYDKNEGDKKVGQIKTYQITFDSDGGYSGQSIEVHESRLVMFPGAKTSLREQARNNGCDLSVLQDKYEIIRDVDATWFAVNELMQNASQGVYKIKGLADIYATNATAIQNRMRLVDFAKGVSRSIILDADMEDYKQVGAQNVGGMEGLLDQAFKRLAASANMPLVVLMGQSPGGLNSSGESDSRNWFNQVEAYQKHVLAPRLEFIMEIILQHEGKLGPGQYVKVDFPSLWEMDENEKADLLVKKANAAKVLIETGVMTPDEVREWFNQK